jgi:hypothetical protein
MSTFFFAEEHIELRLNNRHKVTISDLHLHLNVPKPGTPRRQAEAAMSSRPHLQLLWLCLLQADM